MPREKAFYFFTSIGNYIGESAASLDEFVEKVREVHLKSLEFHLNRGDFGKWVDQALGDRDLAERLINLQNLQPTGESLRDQLYFLVSTRCDELKSV